MTWQRAIETGIPRRGLGGGENWREEHKSGEDNKKDVFLSLPVCLRFFDGAGHLAAIWFHSPMLPSIFLFSFFASLIVHVAPQIRLAVRSGECQHHLSPLLSRTVPEGSTSVRNPLMCSALAYQSVQDVKQLVRGRLSYHNRRWSRNV